MSRTAKEGRPNETCKNFKHPDAEQYSEEGWLWRMPDIMPVSL